MAEAGRSVESRMKTKIFSRPLNQFIDLDKKHRSQTKEYVYLFIASILLAYTGLVLYSHHCLILAEEHCMPKYEKSATLQGYRKISFYIVGWDIGYSSTPMDIYTDGYPYLRVNLFGRIVSATPPFVIDAVDEYQGGRL